MKTEASNTLVRIEAEDAQALFDLIFRRYPAAEWATFARFGWRETPEGLVLTLAALDIPQPGELDDAADHVVIREPYTFRVCELAENHVLAAGVIHSHPRGYFTQASWIDDDMDSYFAEYFGDFIPGRPYVSLIFAHDAAGKLSGTGRVFWKGRWLAVAKFSVRSLSISDRKSVV